MTHCPSADNVQFHAISNRDRNCDSTLVRIPTPLVVQGTESCCSGYSTAMPTILHGLRTAEARHLPILNATTASNSPAYHVVSTPPHSIPRAPDTDPVLVPSCVLPATPSPAVKHGSRTHPLRAPTSCNWAKFVVQPSTTSFAQCNALPSYVGGRSSSPPPTPPSSKRSNSCPTQMKSRQSLRVHWTCCQ
jgi:hypothetical protein